MCSPVSSLPFFIAGAIAALVKNEAILKYFSPDAKKSVSYGIAALSGTVLTVCSSTILPMFAGILKKGSGIGPATSQLDVFIRLMIVYILSMAVAFLLIYYFSRDEGTEWGYEIWDLTKKIVPILLIGTFVLGMLSYFLPPETFRPFIGDNSLSSNFIAALIGAILYMPTLLEVPIIRTTLGYLSGNMTKGPALALLLAGPSVSLPSLLVLSKVMGPKKTGVYAVLVIICSTLAGFIFGNSGF